MIIQAYKQSCAVIGCAPGGLALIGWLAVGLTNE